MRARYSKIWVNHKVFSICFIYFLLTVVHVFALLISLNYAQIMLENAELCWHNA